MYTILPPFEVFDMGENLTDAGSKFEWRVIAESKAIVPDE